MEEVRGLLARKWNMSRPTQSRFVNTGRDLGLWRRVHRPPSVYSLLILSSEESARPFVDGGAVVVE